MKSIQALLFVAVFLPVLAWAGDSEHASDKLAREAYGTVKTAKSFTVGGVGYSGSPSKQETAFRQLLKQSDPIVQCQKLLAEATPAGQLYGLLGLHLLDPKAFQAALHRYKDATTEIETMNGCLISHTTVAKLAKQIEKGELK